MYRRTKSRPGLIGTGLCAVLCLGMAGITLAKAPNHSLKFHKARHMSEGKVVHKVATTTTFSGAKVNAGAVTHTVNDKGECTLTLTDDFVVPDAPAPHWQLVDAEGNVYLLNRLVIKDDKFNKSITVPRYVPNVAKVQIWCAWAEALLGEASFAELID